ncbi:hypothetical protein DESPIG_00119 [Desulfovibrio piger ATCC 29098]|uniref:Uncharacterized protein n=1 Tax=Desulfovibrio piger ATCC 29098 TaxID=411464 RepID=B6WPZ6_9BACT|nr:hypothetical protein DESPIG_00119 [Desulfovibrio piger ATCC 29098]
MRDTAYSQLHTGPKHPAPNCRTGHDPGSLWAGPPPCLAPNNAS